jgi:hypothetical protein
MRTSFHHQPEAQHPNFQLSTSCQADYPIFGSLFGLKSDIYQSEKYQTRTSATPSGSWTSTRMTRLRGRDGTNRGTKLGHVRDGPR